MAAADKTYTSFGHGDQVPWLTVDSVGNFPRNNTTYEAIEQLFKLPNPNPAIDLEPYYAGWGATPMNAPGGERPPFGSERDNYFARAMMYGCVLSGALVGHVYFMDMVPTSSQPPMSLREVDHSFGTL